MSGVMNTTARQFNLKCMNKAGHRVVVRVVPGFNVIDDAHWKDMTNCAYVKQLKKEGFLEYGTKEDKMISDVKNPTKAKSKSEPTPPGVNVKAKAKPKSIDLEEEL